MKNQYKNLQSAGSLSIMLLFIITILSCEKLEVDTPVHLLGGEAIFTDSRTVEVAILALYVKLRDDVLLTGTPVGLSNILGNYSDEITYVSPFGLGDESYYNNSLLPSEPSISNLWNSSYNIIYGANAILEGVANSQYFTEKEKEDFTGEALFVRALVHFYLVNLFGDVPYITSTNYLENKVASRLNEAEVNQRIITDLTMAYNYLPSEDGSGQKLRPTKQTAGAFLARCYLYLGDWELAGQYATEVIENNGWELELGNVFKNTSFSTLWQFSPNNQGEPTQEAITFIVLFTPPSARVLNSDLVAEFEAGDLRREQWVGEISDGTQTYYFPFKYKIDFGQVNNEEYSIVFRMAEQYLIRAEARAHLGDISGAKADLNKIRLRAGLTETTASTQNEVLEAISKERRVELFTEHGHRFFDLKRTGNLDNVLGSKPGWNTTDRLFPLPERELLLNPNLLPQNPGY